MRINAVRCSGSCRAHHCRSKVTGDVPYAHLDIAGPMKIDSDSGIYSKGASGFGTRLLIDLACSF